MSLEERIIKTEERIIAACKRSGRKREDIRIVAVTKYVSLQTTEEVLRQGLAQIGENRWQDARPKVEAIGNHATWHFLGHLQSNKVKYILPQFTYIHSLDRLSLAKELDKRAAETGTRVSCFMQVNVAGEESKFGLSSNQLISFAEQIAGFEHLDIIGLMTMAPHEDDPEKTRPVFKELRRLKDELNDQHIFKTAIPHLSMGMSNDYEVAIEEGATWIRLGSTLVGRE